jgi:heme exporter protein D
LVIIEMKEFFNMGGYGFYVWLSYGITTAVLLANLFWARARQRQVLEALRLRVESGEDDGAAE